jgi:hypothetical protein
MPSESADLCVNFAAWAEQDIHCAQHTALAALANVTAQCVACHEGFRVQWSRSRATLLDRIARPNEDTYARTESHTSLWLAVATFINVPLSQADAADPASRLASPTPNASNSSPRCARC